MANFSAPITYNGITVNGALALAAGGGPIGGYRVDAFDPWSVEVAQAAEKRALRDGYDAGDVYLGRRTVQLIVSVFGSTQGDFHDRVQDLLAAFSPTIAYGANSNLLGFLPFDFYQPTLDISTWPLSAYPYGIPMRMYLRTNAVSGQPLERDNAGGIAALGLGKRFTFSMWAKDPIKFAVTGASSSVASGGSYTNLGDTPTWPFIRIAATTATGTWTGSINGAAWTVNVDGSKFTAAQAAGNNVWMIDARAGILYGQTTTGVASISTGEFRVYVPTEAETGDPSYRFLVKRMDRLDSNSTFPQLAVGANATTYGGTLSPTQIAEWKHAFQ